jgi:hypothetical protein
VSRNFTFKNYEFSRVDHVYLGSPIVTLSDVYFKSHFKIIKGGKKSISPNFSVTFYLSNKLAVRVNVLSEWRISLLEGVEKRNFEDIKAKLKETDCILSFESTYLFNYFPSKDQFEYVIESCIECDKPATLQCSGCNRAVYCGKECGKQSWEKGMHSKVCNKLTLE